MGGGGGGSELQCIFLEDIVQSTPDHSRPLPNPASPLVVTTTLNSPLYQWGWSARRSGTRPGSQSRCGGWVSVLTHPPSPSLGSKAVTALGEAPITSAPSPLWAGRLPDLLSTSLLRVMDITSLFFFMVSLPVSTALKPSAVLPFLGTL